MRGLEGSAARHAHAHRFSPGVAGGDRHLWCASKPLGSAVAIL